MTQHTKHHAPADESKNPKKHQNRQLKGKSVATISNRTSR